MMNFRGKKNQFHALIKIAKATDRLSFLQEAVYDCFLGEYEEKSDTFTLSTSAEKLNKSDTSTHFKSIETKKANVKPSPFNQFLSATSEAKKSLVKKIHLIWLGGILKPQHVLRIQEWNKLNPGYNVALWVDAEFQSEIRKQIPNTAIAINLITSLELPECLTSWISELIKHRKDEFIPNFAAASDIYRFCILNVYGGLYVDTDIIPFSVNTLNIDEILQFHVQGERKENMVKHLSPDVIASNPGSLLTQQALLFLNLISKGFNFEFYMQMIRSNIASTRMLATHLTTGFALRAALGRILVNNKPVIEVYNSKDQQVPDLKLFDQIASKHASTFEQSWILTETKDANFRAALSGLTIDDTYRKLLNGPIDRLSNGLEVIVNITQNIYNSVKFSEASYPIKSPMQKSTELSLSIFRRQALGVLMTEPTKIHAGPLFKAGVCLG